MHMRQRDNHSIWLQYSTNGACYVASLCCIIFLKEIPNNPTHGGENMATRKKAPSQTAQLEAFDVPVFRFCVKGGKVFEEGEMSQCVDCKQFMCTMHVCDCWFEGRSDLEVEPECECAISMAGRRPIPGVEAA
jgi:hypothetical protein